MDCSFGVSVNRESAMSKCAGEISSWPEARASSAAVTRREEKIWLMVGDSPRLTKIGRHPNLQNYRPAARLFARCTREQRASAVPCRGRQVTVPTAVRVQQGQGLSSPEECQLLVVPPSPAHFHGYGIGKTRGDDRQGGLHAIDRCLEFLQ